MDKKKIERINELTQKKKTVGLTPEELSEQKILRDEYRAAFRASLISELDRIEFVDPADKKGGS